MVWQKRGRSRIQHSINYVCAGLLLLLPFFHTILTLYRLAYLDTSHRRFHNTCYDQWSIFQFIIHKGFYSIKYARYLRAVWWRVWFLYARDCTGILSVEYPGVIWWHTFTSHMPQVIRSAPNSTAGLINIPLQLLCSSRCIIYFTLGFAIKYWSFDVSLSIIICRWNLYPRWYSKILVASYISPWDALSNIKA